MKSILIVVLFALMFLGNSVAEEERINNPEQIVKIFYENLFNNKPASECPHIFYNAKTLVDSLGESYKKKTNDDETLWSYFREKKQLLGFGGDDPIKEVNKAKFGYFFPTHREGAPFFEGEFLMIVMHTPPAARKMGVTKQVAFHMVKNASSQYGYLINPSAITINGAYIDDSNEFNRSEDLWKILGFK